MDCKEGSPEEKSSKQKGYEMIVATNKEIWISWIGVHNKNHKSEDFRKLMTCIGDLSIGKQNYVIIG